jgi:hypothetical protein
MSRLRAIATLAAIGIGATVALGLQQVSAQPPLPDVRFAAIAIYVDSSEPLAAWQFELTEATGSMAVVGVENGESAAFPEAPHYDLEAVAQDRADRIIVADYSLAASAGLPRGRTRVATVHVRLSGGREPAFELQLTAAGNADGQPIPAAAVFEITDGSAE